MIRGLIGVPGLPGGFGFGVLIVSGYISDFYYSQLEDRALESNLEDAPYVSIAREGFYYSQLQDRVLLSDAEAME